MHFGFKSKIVLPAIGLIMLRSNTNTTTNTITIRVTIRHKLYQNFKLGLNTFQSSKTTEYTFEHGQVTNNYT